MASALDENFLADHCERFFQADDNKSRCTVFSAFLGGIHVYVFPPSEMLGRKWYTLVTMGVSGTEMRVPERIPDPELYRHVELMCYLPPDWVPPAAIGLGPEADADQLERSWPVDMLRSVGNYVVENGGDVWLSHDHGIPSLTNPDGPGHPFFPTTKLSHMVTLEPLLEKPDFSPVTCAGRTVQFLL